MPSGRLRDPAARRAGVLARAAACAALAACACSAVAQQAPAPAAELPRVRIDTNLGSFIVELEAQRAPLTTANFLQYARSGFYTGTVFHRVINNFVAQAGGFDEKFQPKTPGAGVPNESGNGLSNRRGTIGLARTEAPHSGNAQFYINLADNEDLDPNPVRWGYAVFGRVTEGLDVIDRIGHVATGAAGPWPKDAPVDPVVIRGMQVIGDAAAPATPPGPQTSPPTSPPPGAPSSGAAAASPAVPPSGG
jgi:cyclophilin family peptidyl-prolyl cis-trans isomerase